MARSPRRGKHRAIVWFRGADLRVHDNELLRQAVESLERNESVEIVPLFCYDPRWFSSSHVGSSCKTGPFRAQYLVESVNDLRKNLRALGSDLVIASVAPEVKIPELIPEGGSCTVFAQKDIHAEELEVEDAVREALPPGSTLQLVWCSTLYHPEDLKPCVDVRCVPSPATKFMKMIDDSGINVRGTFPSLAKGDLGPMPPDVEIGTPLRRIEEIPTTIPGGLKTPEKDPRSAFKLLGGESAAIARWKYYLDSHAVATYFETRNGMVGENYSTKLGAALAHGCISPRYVSEQTRIYESKHGANKSTSWIDFELRVRDYYKFYALTHGNAIFKPGGPVGKVPAWREDPGGETFRRWKEGRTGWPLVDANMRELAATGYMSNRGRQNVASFLCLDLNLDWRLGAEYFEEQLVDYDVASNWCSWVAAAGLTGGRVNKFNIQKQSKQYDAQSEYIKLWMPELEDIPSELLHEPQPNALTSSFVYSTGK